MSYPLTSNSPFACSGNFMIKANFFFRTPHYYLKKNSYPLVETTKKWICLIRLRWNFSAACDLITSSTILSSTANGLGFSYSTNCSPKNFIEPSSPSQPLSKCYLARLKVETISHLSNCFDLHNIHKEALRVLWSYWLIVIHMQYFVSPSILECS